MRTGTAVPEECATVSHQPAAHTARKAVGCLLTKKSGGVVFTSPPPCSVGNQLLGAGETPLVSERVSRLTACAAA